MTQSQRKARTRRDLQKASKYVMVEGAVQLPSYARELFRPHRYKVIWGGRGGARSWSVARTLLLITAQRKTRVLCAREMQSSLRDSVHQLLRDQIDMMGLKGFIVTDREIRHTNGSLFLFEGLRHNATKIKSLEGIDICWVEEAERITKESWSILIPTIRKVGSEIWVTFNPDQEDDATYTRFILKTPQDCWTYKAGWEQNPWLSKELLAEKDYMYETDPEGADWVWGGNIRRISDAQILKGKWNVREFTVPYTTDRTGQKVPVWSGPYQGADFGFGVDPNASLRMWVNADTLYIEYESWKLKLETDEMAQQWNEDIPDFHLYTTRADSARPDTISYLRRHGLPRIRPAKKHAGSVADGIAHLRSYREIVIHPRCTHFIQEAKLYSYKVDQRSGNILPIVVDKHNHLMDCARYGLDPLIKPMRRVGLDFVDDHGISVCPVCESLLPDDGECPHCGAIVDMATGQLIDATEHDVPTPDELVLAGEELRAQEVERLLQMRGGDVSLDIIDVPRIDTRHVNGHSNGNGHMNGNGHSNGNGKPKSKGSYSRLRGINDDD